MAKFQTGEQTGQKADDASVSRLMRSEKDENDEQLFDCSEFLTSRQISSFFFSSGLKAKSRPPRGQPER